VAFCLCVLAGLCSLALPAVLALALCAFLPLPMIFVVFLCFLAAVCARHILAHLRNKKYLYFEYCERI
jgi:hypothetical protein